MVINKYLDGLEKGYDGSSATFQLLRSCGWGALLNLGYFRLTDWIFHPFRLDIAQKRLVSKSSNLLDIQIGNNVLDVACGRGYGSYFMAMENPQAQVTGVDILPTSIQIASGLYGNTLNLAFEIADATSLDFSDSSFDRILCLEAAFHFDRSKFLSEMYRVLKPYGIFVVVDFMWIDADSRSVVDSEQGRIVRDTWQFTDFWTIDEYLKKASAIGFELTSKHDWSRKVTEAMTTRFRVISRFGNQPILRKIISSLNGMFKHFGDEDWHVLFNEAQAHDLLCRASKYNALVFKK